jgi:hypothetical protein
MVLKLVQMASQGLSGADADTRGWRRNGGTRQANATGDFWPEVSGRYGLENPAPMKSETAPRRILFEIFVVLAVVASFVVAVALLLPGGASR